MVEFELSSLIMIQEIKFKEASRDFNDSRGETTSGGKRLSKKLLRDSVKLTRLLCIEEPDEYYESHHA